MARFISLCVFSMVTLVALAKNFNDSIPTSDRNVTITSKELALTFNKLVRYYESKSEKNPFSIVDDESALNDYIIEDLLTKNCRRIEFTDVNLDRGIYSVMHRGSSNPDRYILICYKKRLDVFNTRSSKSLLDALNYIYRIERQGEFEIEYWQFKQIVGKLLILNLGRGIYYPSSRKFDIFNLHDR